MEPVVIRVVHPDPAAGVLVTDRIVFQDGYWITTLCRKIDVGYVLNGLELGRLVAETPSPPVEALRAIVGLSPSSDPPLRARPNRWHPSRLHRVRAGLVLVR